jgi:hypothetical protein
LELVRLEVVRLRQSIFDLGTLTDLLHMRKYNSGEWQELLVSIYVANFPVFVSLSLGLGNKFVYFLL